MHGQNHFKFTTFNIKSCVLVHFTDICDQHNGDVSPENVHPVHRTT